MKKVFMILGTCLAAALVMVSCQDDKKPDNKDKENKENKEDEGDFSMDVVIDGDFSEWDKLTADTADGAYFLYEENGNANFDGVLRLKLTSDKDYIYVYTELKYENIFVTDAEAFPDGIAAGSSATGFTPHPGTPGGLMIYVGMDGDDAGSYAARVCAIDDESMWSYTGFDAMAQYYFCWDSAKSKMQFGWQQNNAAEVASPGDPLNDHGDGWIDDTPAHDGDVSTESDVAFSGIVKVTDPATNKQVDAIRIELQMDRQGFLKCYGIDKKAEGQAVIGIFYEQVGDVNKQTDATGAGKLPSGKSACVLKLK